jgi:hypothetical protein
VPVVAALGGAAGMLFLDHLWNALLFASAAILVLSILYMAKSFITTDD